MREQAGRLLHGLGDVHAHPLRVELARRLVELAPVDEPQVFFAISGAEAVEIALKTALGATGRPGILAFEPSYHGMTLGALAVTSREEFRAPFAAHLHGHVRRLPFGGDLARVGGGPGGRRDRRGDRRADRRPRGGADPAAPAGSPGSRSSAGSHGALLIADEIFTGFGRTGRLFAVEHEGVRPDILCCGKALGGGLPIAAVIARRDLFRCWETPGEARHTATFLANPLACAAALAALDVLQEEDLAARAARLGAESSAAASPPGRSASPPSRRSAAGVSSGESSSAPPRPPRTGCSRPGRGASSSSPAGRKGGWRRSCRR